jgi:hypothetical protein
MSAPVELQSREQTYPPASIVLTVQKWFWVVLAMEVLAIILFQIPTRMGFNGTAFGDYGLNLLAQFLIQHGYRPGVDFGYPYGSLSLLLGKLAFTLFGLRPLAFVSAVTICDLAFAMGLARFAYVLRLRAPALALIAISVPFCILFDITFGHVLERVFLAWALAAHADRRRSRALALITCATLAKPSMGFVYGFLLLTLIVVTLWRESKLTIYYFIREVQSAVVTATVVSSVAIAAYGVPATFRLSIPLTGAEAYRAANNGFFTGAGRAFWYFPGVHPGYYFGTGVAFWFVASVCLIAGGCSSVFAVLASFKNREQPTEPRELTLFCALLHVAFVTLFFGNMASWTSYPYLLSMGVGAMTLWSDFSEKVVWLLIVLGVAGQKGMIEINSRAWFSTAPSTVTAGLWASSDERDEWIRVVALAKGNSSVVLSYDGCAQLIFAELTKPVAATMMRGQTTASELARKMEQLSAAQIAIVPEVLNNAGFLNAWPEFNDKLSKWGVIVFKGSYFTVYQRAASRVPTTS